MNAGLLAVFFATAFWGLAFLLPLWLPEFSSVEVAVGRFVFYGLTSASVSLLRGRMKCLPWGQWRQALLFTLASLLVYYVLLVESIRFLGGAFATALSSLLPIAASIYGNYRSQVVPWKVLSLPIFGIFAGLLMMHFGTLEFSGSYRSLILGLICSFSSVSLWAWYAVKNGEFLRGNKEIDATDWVALIGIFAFIGGVTFLLFFYLVSPETLFLLRASPEEWQRYLLVSFINGLFVSYLTNVLWNFASRRVPMAFLGQFTVLEIFFGLSYVYLFKGEYPLLLEILGLSVIFTCLALSIIRLKTPTEVKE